MMTGFFGIQHLHIITECVLPRHAIVQTLELVLRIGHIDRNQIKVLIFCRDDTPFMVVLLDAQSSGN